ncbi:hypothetical protein MRB53_037450 [Persea americana]|nr:hypothetical protein MRB53_037450 [Persea americana]
MIPLAIRIAEALGMPKNLQDNRKAIWFSIGMLDIQASFDRGSKPLMLVEDFSDSMESADNSIIHFEHSAAKTAMWQAMMCNRTLFDYQSYQRSLTHQFRTWSEWQHAVLQEFEQYTERLSMICDNLGASATHLQKFTVCIARESLLSMRLLLARPLYDYNRAKEPDNADADDSLHVLHMAVDLLMSAQMKADPEYDIYGWYSWVKWYALAIALSELCKQPCNQDTLHAWEVTKSSFKSYARLVADNDSGLLWRPIAKLMKRTEERWEKAIEQTSTTTINNDYDPFDQKHDLDPWTFFTLDFQDQSMLDDFDPAAWLVD